MSEKRTNWRGVDLVAYFVLLGGAGAAAFFHLWGTMTVVSGVALLQLAETILHALADSFKDAA